MSASNEQLMHHFLSFWATREAAAMVEMFATDGIYDNVPKKKPLHGQAEIAQWLDACFEHLTRIDVEVLHIASNGGWVLSERLDTHVIGDRHMRLPVMNVSQIVNGKFQIFRDYFDRQTVADLDMG